MLFRAVLMLTTGTANPPVASGSGTDVLSQMCWGYRANHPLNSPTTWGCQEMEQWWETLPEAQPALSIQPGQDQNVPQHSCWHWCHPCPQTAVPGAPGSPPCWDTLRCEANPWRLKLWQQTQNWGAPSWSEVEFALESLSGPGFSALCPLSTPEGETKF